MTATLPLAEQFRRALLAKCKHATADAHPDGVSGGGLRGASAGGLRGDVSSGGLRGVSGGGLRGDIEVCRRSPAFWGKSDDGRLLNGHEHAFFLPTDDDGDGALDHLTVFSPMGFSELERQAIDSLRRLSVRGEWTDAGIWPKIET